MHTGIDWALSHAADLVCLLTSLGEPEREDAAQRGFDEIDRTLRDSAHVTTRLTELIVWIERAAAIRPAPDRPRRARLCKQRAHGVIAAVDATGKPAARRLCQLG